LERAQQTSTRLHAALSDVLKETHTYADELHKAQRELKHKATLDAVNLMQTTTTCLQKVITTLANIWSYQTFLCSVKGNLLYTMH
jgi:hypothetical protein